MKTLLVLCYHFPPSGAVGGHRILGMARHLPSFGWRVVIIAPPGAPGEPEDPTLETLVPDRGVIVIRPAFPTRFGRYNQDVWLLSAYRAAAEAIRDFAPDVLLTSSPPDNIHLLGRALQLRRRLPWVADFRDPWHTHRWGSSTPPFARQGEAMVLRRADAVLANTPVLAASLTRLQPERAAHIHVIPNGFDPEFTSNLSRDNRPKPITLLHAGEIYGGRDPRPLFDALQAVIARRPAQPMRLRLVGSTTHATHEITNEINKRGLGPYVDVIGHVSYFAALQEMVEADILVLLHLPGRLPSVPAKLYEYLGAGRPILALAEPASEVAAIAQHAAAPARVASPGCAHEIAAALESLLSDLRIETVRPDAAVLAYSRQAIAGRLAIVLAAIMQASK